MAYKRKDGYKVETTRKSGNHYNQVLEHRSIMEKYLGRRLTNNEVIHHINENPEDNRIKNLQLMSRSEHTKIHSKKPEMIKFNCAKCGKLKEIRKKLYHLKIKKGQKNFYCCNACIPRPNGIVSKKSKNNILKGLKKGWTGYKIAKDFGLNKKTVYTYLNSIKLQ